jgi:acylphosphatase
MLKREWFIAVILTFIALTLVNSPARAAETIKIFPDQKRIEVAGEMSLEMGKYKQLQGAIEYLACSKGGKTYESMVVLKCSPTEFYEALRKIGLKPGKAAYFDDSGKHVPPSGDKVRIFIEWKNSKGKTMHMRAEDLIHNKKTKKSMQHIDWIFAGSTFMEDPETEKQVLQAEYTGSIVSTHHGDHTVIIQNPLSEALDESIYSVNQKLAPKPGTKIKFIVDGAPMVQLFVLISGKVQGVGFRDFTKKTADQMNVYGYVKNLRNGKVEAVLAGRKSDVDKLLEKLRVGPRPANVTDLKAEERKFTGKYKDFQIEM